MLPAGNIHELPELLASFQENFEKKKKGYVKYLVFTKCTSSFCIFSLYVYKQLYEPPNVLYMQKILQEV